MAQTTSSQPHEMTLHNEKLPLYMNMNMNMNMSKVIEEMERGKQSVQLMKDLIDQRLRVKVEDVHVHDLDYLKALDDHNSVALKAFVNSLSFFKSMEFDGEIMKKRKVDSHVASDDHCIEEISKNPIAKDRRGCYKRRKIGESKEIEVTQLTDDGFAWRKYGQKVILNTKHPRNYYRCTHKHDQNCQAIKQVQQVSDSPPNYRIVYHGNHTCKRSSKSSPIIIDSPPEHSALILLNFESNSATTKYPELFPTLAYPTANTVLKQEQFAIKEEVPSVSHSHHSYDVCNHYPSSSSDNQSSFHQCLTNAATGVPSTPISYQSDGVSVAENYSSTASSCGTVDDYSSMWADYSELFPDMFGFM